MTSQLSQLSLMSQMSQKKLQKFIRKQNAQASIPMQHVIHEGTEMAFFYTTGFVDRGQPELLMPAVHKSLAPLFSFAVVAWCSNKGNMNYYDPKIDMHWEVVPLATPKLEQMAKNEYMGKTQRFCGKRSFDVMLVIPRMLGISGPRSNISVSVNQVRLCAKCCRHSFSSRRCARCRLQWYCSKECQVSDWSNHKAICKVHDGLDTCGCCAKIKKIPKGANKKECHHNMRKSSRKFAKFKRLTLVDENRRYIAECCGREHRVFWWEEGKEEEEERELKEVD